MTVSRKNKKVKDPRINVPIDPDLRDRFKKAAKDKGLIVKAALAQAMEAWIKKPQR